jgi:hypothetical protein
MYAVMVSPQTGRIGDSIVIGERVARVRHATGTVPWTALVT